MYTVYSTHASVIERDTMAIDETTSLDKGKSCCIVSRLPRYPLECTDNFVNSDWWQRRFFFFLDTRQIVTVFNYLSQHSFFFIVRRLVDFNLPQGLLALLTFTLHENQLLF